MAVFTPLLCMSRQVGKGEDVGRGMDQEALHARLKLSRKISKQA